MAPGSDRGLRLIAASLRDTQAIAAALAERSSRGDVILLHGEMGAGKTAFVQGFARALGIDEPVTSPTFNLVHTYDTGRLTVHHADLYRLDRYGEIDDLGLDELTDSGVLLIEWGEPAVREFPDRLEVTLAADPERDDARTLVLGAAGQAWAARWPVVRDAVAPWEQVP